MSADNGIYIHKFKEGWKVVHAQAIENIYWQRGDNKYNYRILHKMFEDGKLFKKREKAYTYAMELCNKQVICEYGVCEV